VIEGESAEGLEIFEFLAAVGLAALKRDDDIDLALTAV
jgi:hypothetical protein